MGTVFRNPHWLVPDNANKTKKANYSLDFNGTDSYVDLGTDPIVTGEFSISMWIKRSSTSVGDATQVLIGKDNQATARVFNIFFKNITGQISFWVSSTGTYSGTYRVDTSTAINDTNWHNIVFLNKGDGQLNEIYIDGTEASYTAQGEGRTTLFNTTAIKTSIGADALTGTTYNFNGQISQVCMFDYVLSPSDISTLYGNATDGVGDPLSLTTPPIAYYLLSDEMVYNGGNYLAPNMINSNIGSGNFMSPYFSGVSSVITIPTYPAFDTYYEASDGYTVSYWLNSKGTTYAYANILNGNGFFNYLSSAAGIGIKNNNGGWRALVPNGDMVEYRWYHVVHKVDAANVNTYLDGVLKSTFATGSAWQSSRLYNIGSKPFSRNFVGNISQVAIINNTSVSVSDLYNGGIQPDITNFNDLGFLMELNQDAEVGNNRLLFKETVSNMPCGSTLEANDSLSGDSPNGGSAGIGYNFQVEDLKNNAPYSSSNVISRNSIGYGQLLSFGANQTVVEDPTSFYVTVQTGLGSSLNDNQAAIQTAGTNNFTVYWGDGSSETVTASAPTATIHAYSTPGVYQVKIDGDYTPYWNDSGYANCFLNIKNWGDNSLIRSHSFRGCHNMDVTALDAPASLDHDLQYLFGNCNNLQNLNGSIANWDVSNVDIMAYMFINSYMFNGEINNWRPVSNVNLLGTFRGCYSFNQPIGEWGVSPSNMAGTFYSTRKFDQNLNNWTWPASVHSLFRLSSYKFSNGGVRLTQQNTTDFYESYLPLNGFSDWTWTHGNPRLLRFHNNTAPADNFYDWNPVTPVAGSLPFAGPGSVNGDLSNWDLSNLSGATLFYLKYSSPNLVIDLSTFNPTSLNSFMRSCHCNGSWIANINTSNVTTFYRAFRQNNLLNQDLGDYDISSSTNFQETFYGATMDVSNITSTATKWAIKVYNGNGNTGISATNMMRGRTFDNSQTSDTGGTAFPFPSNFSLSIGGSPDLTGGGDYCKVVDVSGDNQLEGKDMYSSSTAGTDYVELLTREISGDGTDVSVTIPYYWNHNPTIASTTGLTADYKIDGGTWTNFINDTTSSGSGSSSGTNASPVEGFVESLSFSTSFQVRLRIQTGQATANTCNVKSITISDGEGDIYVEDFSTQLGVGYDDGLTSPNAVWSDAGDALDWLSSSTGGNWIDVTSNLTRIN